jgi:hypothetical protein
LITLPERAWLFLNSFGRVARAAGLVCQAYLDHIVDRRGRLCAHRQLGRSVKRTLKTMRPQRPSGIQEQTCALQKLKTSENRPKTQVKNNSLIDFDLAQFLNVKFGSSFYRDITSETLAKGSKLLILEAT